MQNFRIYILLYDPIFFAFYILPPANLILSFAFCQNIIKEAFIDVFESYIPEAPATGIKVKGIYYSISCCQN